MANTERTATGDWMMKCRHGHITVTAVRETMQGWLEWSGKHGAARCPVCTAAGMTCQERFRPIVARVTDHQCGPKCTSATGPTCDCKCGGKRHGSDHSLVGAE